MANIVKEINKAVDECGGKEFNPNPPNVIEGYKDLQIERENREKYIEQLEAEILSNNQYINFKNKEIERLEKWIKSLQKEIKDNENDILDLNNQIEYMDEKKQELEYIITNKDKEILDLNCIIEGKDEKIDFKKLCIKQKDKEIEKIEKKLKSFKEKRMYYLKEREELEEKYLYSDDESDEEAVIHDEDTFENPDDYSKFIEMTMNGISEYDARQEIKLYNEAKATGNYETYFANMED